MKLLLFSIRDSKANVFNPPFSSNTYGEAERSFLSNQQNPESMLSKYPEDFSLHHVGEIDQQTGELTASPPKHVCQALRPKSDLKSV